jgi:threonine/homoserine efflux transporter RhtA
LEAVFAALFGWLFLHKMLLPVGWALILTAVVLALMKNGKITAI